MDFKIIFKKVFLFVSLFYLTLFVPLMFVVFSSIFWDYNFENQGVYDVYNESFVEGVSSDLRSYFLFRNELGEEWSSKEVTHFSDVRGIYVILFGISIFAIVFLVLFFDKGLMHDFAEVNVILSLFLGLILPFFNLFWDKVFHPLIFNNDNWILLPGEVSYYLFSYSFFVYSFVFILLSSIVINTVLYVVFRQQVFKT